MQKIRTSGPGIRKKLSYSYGTVMLSFLAIFVIFNLVTISQLKTRGIDRFIEKSMSHFFANSEEQIRNSVRIRLRLENDNLIELARIYTGLVDEGTLPRDVAQQRLLDLIVQKRIGQSGYPYVIDTSGTVLAHPNEEYIGQNYKTSDSLPEPIIEHLQKQLAFHGDYIEYSAPALNGSQVREKMLVMDRFKPWNWIISTTAYADDPYVKAIRINEIQYYMTNETITGIHCVSMIDGDGNFLIHPENPTVDKMCIEDNIIPRLPDIKKNILGEFSLPMKDGDGHIRNSVVYYSYLASLDWVILGVGTPGDLYKPIYTAYIMTGIFVFVLGSAMYLLNRRFSRNLTAPLHTLVSVLDSGSDTDFSVRADIRTGDEYELLSSHFNSFMDTHQKFLDKLQDAHLSIKLLARFPDENPNPILRLSTDRVVNYANSAAQKSILDHFDVRPGDTIPEEMYARLTKADTLSGRNEFVLGDRTYSFTTSSIQEPDELYFYGIDITRQKKFESLQLLSENIFHNSSEGIVITDAEGTIESVNPAFTVITGYSEKEAIGENPRILKSHKHNNEFYAQMWHDLKNKGYWADEIWNRRKNGSVYPEFLTITSVRNNLGEIVQFISFFHDLTEVKEKERKIVYEATHDRLTDLPNREYLLKKIGSLIKQSLQYHTRFSIVYVDLNNFKKVNESLGPETGDKLLIDAAERLTELIKPPDSVVRVGSDEFVCLLAHKGEESEIAIVIDDLKNIFTPSFFIGGHDIDIDISVGVSVYPADDTEPMNLIAKAEAAMHEAKKDVNRIYSFYSPTFHQKGLNRLQIEAGLKSAFENQRFFVNYQPKVSSRTGLITGAEALVRVEPIEDTFIGPDIFIPVAEEIGLIEPLGAWVLEKVCKDTRTLIDIDIDTINVAVNLSPWQFMRNELPVQVKNILESTGLPSENLSLEITESMAIANVDESIEMMQRLTEIGLSLSIDDFGTGYSSLSYLAKFPVQTLKIDKSFVDGIPGDSKSRGIVTAILALAENLGMETVGEGIETEEQYTFLRDAGCDRIQGYYFYKPMKFDEYKEILVNQHTANQIKTLK